MEHTEHTHHQQHHHNATAAHESEHENHAHLHHEHHHHGSTRGMAASATLHCLTGCAVGEILGLIIGTALGLSGLATMTIAISLAFLFGYAFSALPLVKVGLTFGAAISTVLAADTLSILAMEVVENGVMAVMPGAMGHGVSNPFFWVSMSIALVAGYLAAYPVNYYLLKKNKGHALTHEYHGAAGINEGFRKYIPNIATSTLVVGISSFLAAGFIVSLLG